MGEPRGVKVALRLAAEFVVIVTGVLVALAVDEWRVERDEARLELEYAARLHDAFEADTARISGYLQGRLAAKKDVLVRLSEGRELDVARPAWTAFALEATFDRGIPDVRAETFREMQAAGHLGLLGSAELRDRLGAYYAWHELASRGFTETWSDFAPVVSRRIPPSFWELELSVVTADDVAEALAPLMEAPALAPEARAELAYTATMERITRELLSRARGVLELLDHAYPSDRTPEGPVPGGQDAAN